ncbi:ABC-type nickel/cobalt efflux system, permease component RcnA [Ectothiorhodosinus mongolicus]|uniref:Nickel/cobalt efflux system n=1 Tax=Ectothiorhodosinus mongolicus TaxID=233100 RepID=A0A1R3VUL4_9GAMM|nr:nickel/cobalt transporter [Ectothiorhodosinus mongolicus]ULX56843.1 high frequency lysogenization protein HflD [Ectothiorhodosinus mongolicus]SIT68599.1 ABC-type nickel/cobalt efflux system, permease component RcnA [Ectothiorhodosinus mongolicus]
MRTLGLCLLLSLMLILPSQALAQDAVTPERATATEQVTGWMIAQQRSLHRQLANTMEAVDQAPTAVNAGLLILVSFLYGIFHAAGPGHGKIVITTYLATHRQYLHRALGLSLASSLLQGLTAIAAVGLTLLVLGQTARSAMNQAVFLERASFALVALLGMFLLLRALRQILRQPAPAPAPAAHPEPHEHAEHEHGHGHHPHAQHSDACGCGHAHHVTPDQAARVDSLGSLLATVAAVGIRPCTGAILVLVFAHILGLWLAGLLAVLAMSLGTAMTVGALALLAVSARDWASRLASGALETGALRWLGPAVSVLGGLIILWIGATLFLGSLHAPPPRLPGL